MKKIPLTQGQFAIVDDEDFEEQNQWGWYAYWNPETHSFYARRNEGKRPNRKTILMHREIMNTPKMLKCDHINHDTLNNTRLNLRNVTNSQNGMNRKSASKTNLLGILGVVKISRGFRAHITQNGKVKWFPIRRKLDDAIEDRRIAETEVYGEYAPSR